MLQTIPYIAKDINIEHRLNRIFQPIYQLQISNNGYNNILLPFRLNKIAPTKHWDFASYLNT